MGRFLSAQLGWSEFALCSNGRRRSVQPEIVALPGPSDRDCPRLGQPIGGEIDGPAAVEDAGGDLWIEERQLQDAPDIAIVEAFGPGDVGHRWRRI